MATLDEARDAVGSLPPEEQQELAREVLLGQPQGDKGRTAIWILVLLILGGAVFVFGTMIFHLLMRDKAVDAFISFVSLALGAVAGLLAPSPVRRG